MEGGEGMRVFSFFIWFSLQGDCEGPKVVLFYSLPWVSHMGRILEAHFCFGLVWKVVVEVQKEFFFPMSMGWSHGHNTRDKLLFGFSLQSGCGGPKKFYFFLLAGCATCTET
jgi:hypothetical protein